VHASAGRAGAAALLVAAARSSDVLVAASGVLEAATAGVLEGVVVFRAVELAVDEQPATPRTSAATITWCTLNLLFMTATPPSRTRG
jgi:hypothetical protein